VGPLEPAEARDVSVLHEGIRPRLLDGEAGQRREAALGEERLEAREPLTLRPVASARVTTRWSFTMSAACAPGSWNDTNPGPTPR
jgi:hypothetical protein